MESRRGGRGRSSGERYESSKVTACAGSGGGEDDPAEDVADMVVVRGEEGKQDEVAGYSMVVAPKRDWLE